jgi:MFS family permease
MLTFVLQKSTVPAVYGFTVAQAGLVQLVSGIGMLVGTYLSGRYSDYVFRNWRTKRGVTVPEDRLRATWPAIIALVVGCLMMGWALVTGVHWAVPSLGAIIAGAGVMGFATSTNAYLIDLFQGNASSIIASANFLRFTLAAIGPLTVTPMQAAMGTGGLYTFWAAMNLLAYASLVCVVFFGTKYRNGIEPWKSMPVAKEQLRAIGALAEDEEVANTAGAVTEVDVSGEKVKGGIEAPR